MTMLNEYCLLLDVRMDEQEQLRTEAGAAVIIERTGEGIVHIWPARPMFRPGEGDPASEIHTNQDLTNYLTDGDWCTADPWMYFENTADVIALMNKKGIPIHYRDLGRYTSIRTVRTMLEAGKMIR